MTLINHKRERDLRINGPSLRLLDLLCKFYLKSDFYLAGKWLQEQFSQAGDFFL